jgi:hypothetical protein
MDATQVVRRRQRVDEAARYGYSLQAPDVDEFGGFEQDASAAALGRALAQMVAAIPVALAVVLAFFALVAVEFFKESD